MKAGQLRHDWVPPGLRSTLRGAAGLSGGRSGSAGWSVWLSAGQRRLKKRRRRLWWVGCTGEIKAFYTYIYSAHEMDFTRMVLVALMLPMVAIIIKRDLCCITSCRSRCLYIYTRHVATPASVLNL